MVGKYVTRKLEARKTRKSMYARTIVEECTRDRNNIFEITSKVEPFSVESTSIHHFVRIIDIIESRIESYRQLSETLFVRALSKDEEERERGREKTSKRPRSSLPICQRVRLISSLRNDGSRDKLNGPCDGRSNFIE